MREYVTEILPRATAGMDGYAIESVERDVIDELVVARIRSSHGSGVMVFRVAEGLLTDIWRSTRGVARPFPLPTTAMQSDAELLVASSVTSGETPEPEQGAAESALRSANGPSAMREKAPLSGLRGPAPSRGRSSRRGLHETEESEHGCDRASGHRPVPVP